MVNPVYCSLLISGGVSMKCPRCDLDMPGPGALKVEILRDGKTISEGAADTPYGVVTLKTPLPDKNTIVNQILKMVLGK